MQLAPGEAWEPVWHVPDPDGQPIARIGFELTGDQHAGGSVYLDFLSWDGTPEAAAAATGGRRTRLAPRLDQRRRPFRPLVAGRRCGIIHDEGRGLLSQGTRDWTDYSAQAMITPHMAVATGIAVRVQGTRRITRCCCATATASSSCGHLTATAYWPKAAFEWQFGQAYDSTARGPAGSHLRAWSTASCCSISTIPLTPLTGGAVGLLIEQGRAADR